MTRQKKTKRPAVANPYRTFGMASLQETFILLSLGVAGLVACYFYFLAYPNLDMQTTGSFYNEETRRFEWAYDTRVHTVRRSILNSITVFYVAVTILGLRAYRYNKPVLRFEWNKWLFLGVAGLTGPVLLVNVMLKGNWGRARPKDVSEFGGNLEFTPFWQWADQCRDNCSFVSGEVASVAMIFLSIGLILSTRWRWFWFLIGVVPLVGTAWLRISTGSHFLSDTVVSLPLMIIMVALTYYWFYFRKNPLLNYVQKLSEQKPLAKN